MKRTVLTIAALFGLAVVSAAVFVYSGQYEVAADRPHWALTEALLKTLRDRSIETSAASIQVPKLDDPRRIAKGASQYAEMCAGCHLSPASRDSDTRRGLYPQPPDFYRERPGLARAFWVTKHGLKMTGMPAWGPTHDDDAIWSLVAFLQKMPDLDAETYRRLAAQSGTGH